MDLEQALRIISRHRACPHDNHDTRLGDGRTWAKCDDCGMTFARSLLPHRRAAIREFDEAIESIRAHAAKARDTSTSRGDGRNHG